MKKNQRRSFKIIAIFFVAVFFVAVNAVSPAKADDKLQTTDGFKYYKFNSVNASLSSPIASTVAGATLHVNVELTNNNEFPLAEGALYVKIFKKQYVSSMGLGKPIQGSDAEKIMKNGFAVVDQFFAADGISLEGKEKKTVTFDYKIPTTLAAGDYQIAAFFSEAKKFSLLGMSFSDDAAGNSMDFSVSNPQVSGGVEFDKNNVKVNDTEYDFAAFIQNYGQNDDVKIQAPIVNSTSAPQTVNISRNLYYFDGLLPENKIDSQNISITLNPKETRVLDFVVKGNNYPVNYLILKADWKDSHSILGIRFGRYAPEKIMLDFAGLNSFPLMKNEANKIFLVAHAVKDSSGPADAKNADSATKPPYHLTAKLLDKNGSAIGSYAYDGPIQGEPLGLEAGFIPTNNENIATIEATVQDSAGNIMDKATLVYNCSKFGKGICTGENVGQAASENKSRIPLVIFVFIVLIIAIAIILYMKKRKNNLILPIFLVAVSLALLSAKGVDAAQTKSVVFSNNAPNLAYLAQEDGSYHGLINVNYTVKYSAQSTITDGVILSPGDIFSVQDMSLIDATSLYWTGLGYSAVTPYGYWNQNADFISNLYPSCGGDKNCIVGNTSNAKVSGIPLWAYFVMTPPAVSPNVIGPANCVSDAITPGKWNCTVNSSPGSQIQVNLSYSNTSGKFYYLSAYVPSLNGIFGCPDHYKPGFIFGLFQEKIKGMDTSTHDCDSGSYNCTDYPDCSSVAPDYEGKCCNSSYDDNGNMNYCQITTSTSSCVSPGITGGEYYYSGYGSTGNGTSCGWHPIVLNYRSSAPCNPPADYKPTVDAQNLSFTYQVAGSTSARPTAALTYDPPNPTIATAVNFTVTGTDDNSTSLRYFIDYNNDGVADDFWDGPVGNHIFSYTWLAASTYAVQARTQELDATTGALGQFSDWAQVNVPVAAVSVSGQCKTPPNNWQFCPSDPNTPDTLSGSGLCDIFNPSNPPNAVFNSTNNIWTWTCYGQNGGSDIPCQASLNVKTDGQCGSANSTQICNDTASPQWCKPGSTLDLNGSQPAVDSYDTTWQCDGTCGGTPATCTAKGKKSCGWIETNP